MAITASEARKILLPLIERVNDDRTTGIGKPEPLRHMLLGSIAGLRRTGTSTWQGHLGVAVPDRRRVPRAATHHRLCLAESRAIPVEHGSTG